MGWGWGWRPYVPVAERRRKALQKLEKLKKKGRKVRPVEISSRAIATTFWGKSWCSNLEAYSDYANRLPRGRTYVRNGSVIDLQIQAGQVRALVSGSDIYTVDVNIQTLKPAAWRCLKKECTGQIPSLLDLLQGRLSKTVMEVVTRRQTGLFPTPAEITFKCSCPDWAYMCKHVAAVLYGVGARLDNAPELLFLLRNVNHDDLITQQAAAATVVSAEAGGRIIAADQLAGIFGIDIDAGEAPEMSQKRRTGRPRKTEMALVAETRKYVQEKKRTGTSKRELVEPAPVKRPGRTARVKAPLEDGRQPRKKAAKTNKPSGGKKQPQQKKHQRH